MINFPAEYFNPVDTLDCGQVFRFRPVEDGYIVFSLDKCARLKPQGDDILIESSDDEYFANYFDLKKNYAEIVDNALKFNIEKLSYAAKKYRGIRILRQNVFETLISFLISQNNNIPRIKSAIEKTCAALGEKRIFDGTEYYAFPTAEKLAFADDSFYKSAGYGYRGEYVKKVSEAIVNKELDLSAFNLLSTPELKKELLKIKGVGEKVADCVAFFGYSRSDSFPVDTWIEKIYREDFGGELKDRKKITKYLVSAFGLNSGYVQQYLFYAKRKGDFDDQTLQI